MVEEAPHGLLLHASAIFFSSSVPVTLTLRPQSRGAESQQCHRPCQAARRSARYAKRQLAAHIASLVIFLA